MFSNQQLCVFKKKFCSDNGQNITLVIINTALAGTDYVNVSSKEVFPFGSTNGATTCVDITILDDNAMEGDQTFNVALTTSNPNVLLGNIVAVISIINNDSKHKTNCIFNSSIASFILQLYFT